MGMQKEPVGIYDGYSMGGRVKQPVDLMGRIPNQDQAVDTSPSQKDGLTLRQS
jgi:hypothetical protein